MILDYMRNIGLYEGCNKNLSKIAKFIAENDLKSLEKGKYDLGDECFVNILESNPSPASTKWESHVKYLDVQYIVTGSEVIEWQIIENMQKTTEYDAVKDRFLGTSEIGKPITVDEGMFMILFPEDAHCPGIKANHDFVKKAVFKIKI